MPPSTDEDYHQINDVANKAILQELIENSGDEVTAEILKCYKIGASDADIKKDFSRWKVAPLRNTATYLLVETEGKLKADIINDVISKIEALLMELCTVCSKYYHNTLGDVPVYTCTVCQQGCHQPCYEEVFNALQTLDPKYQNSMHFICSSCQRVYQPQPNTEAAANTNPSKVKKSPTKTPNENNENPIDKSFEADREPPEKDVQPPENTEICPEYKWKKCPNYDQCKFKHPPRCKDLLRDGKCRFKKKCKFHHPPICRYSLKERKCLNQECKFFHLAKTLRHNIDEQRNVTNENPSRSQIQQPSHDQPNNTQSRDHPPSQPQPPELIQSTNTTSKPVNQNLSVDPVNNYLPFLLTMMQKLKEDLLGHLGKEIADLKQNIIPNRSQTVVNSQSTPNPAIPSSQQVLFNPLLQGMCVKPQLVHHQQSSC